MTTAEQLERFRIDRDLDYLILDIGLEPALLVCSARLKRSTKGSEAERTAWREFVDRHRSNQAFHA